MDNNTLIFKYDKKLEPNFINTTFNIDNSTYTNI